MRMVIWECSCCDPEIWDILIFNYFFSLFETFIYRDIDWHAINWHVRNVVWLNDWLWKNCITLISLFGWMIWYFDVSIRPHKEIFDTKIPPSLSWKAIFWINCQFAMCFAVWLRRIYAAKLQFGVPLEMPFLHHHFDFSP